MDEPTLTRFMGGLGYKIYGSNKTISNWLDQFWPVNHMGLIRVCPIGPKSLFNFLK